MTVVANLSALLSADTSKLKKGFGGLRSALGGLTGAIGGLVGGIGLGAIVKGGLDAADAIQKMTIRTGASAEMLSVLKNAASQSDIDFTAVGKSITRLNRSLGEATAGTAAQSEAFEALGLNLDDLSKMTVDQRFIAVADALSKVKDEALVSRLGMDLFGKGFEQMRPMIADGAAGLEEFRKQAEATGQVLSQDQVDAAAKANDAMQLLQNTIAALGTQFAVGLAPSIVDAVKVLQDNLPAIMEVAGQVFDFIGKSIDVVGTALGGIAAIGGAVLNTDYRAAGGIASALVNDLTAIIVGEDSAAEETARSNEILAKIAENTQRGSFTLGVAG